MKLQKTDSMMERLNFDSKYVNCKNKNNFCPVSGPGVGGGVKT